MGYAKYYEDIVLAQSDREYMISSQNIKGRITGLKIDEANSVENKQEKQSVFESIKYSIAEVEYSISFIDNMLEDLTSDTIIEKFQELISNLDNRRTNLYEYLYDEIFKGYSSKKEFNIEDKYKNECKQFIVDLLANLIKNLLPENSIELRRFEDDIERIISKMYNQQSNNAFEDIIKISSIDFTAFKCSKCRKKTYREITFCINCLQENKNE